MANDQSVQFEKVTVASKSRQTPSLFHISIEDLPPGFQEAYRTPGQYVQLKTQEDQEKPGFFALASGPSQQGFDFLIKGGAPLADEAIAKNIGEPLWITAPGGKGYPLDEAEGQELVLIGMGSGLAPLRAVVQTALSSPQRFDKVRLIYGGRKAEDLPYAEEFVAWKEAGVACHCVLSKPEPSSWDGPAGRVQDLLQSLELRFPESACAFACGTKEMVNDLKEILPEMGLPAERIFQNF